MKQRIIPAALILAGLTFYGLKQQGNESPNVISKEATKEVKIERSEPEVSPKDIDRTVERLKKAQAPSYETIGKELETSGEEATLETFKAYQKQQAIYDKAFARYEALHSEYRKAVHAAPDGNSPEVEAALAAVDTEMETLQAEMEGLNAASAEFLEEYRRFTFEKFGLALN